jgi:Tol biopolymer transport system component
VLAVRTVPALPLVVAGLALALGGCGESSPQLTGTIAFMHELSSIGIVDAGGSARRVLAHGTVEGPLRWSPEGTKLVFTMSSGGRNRLYVAGPGGSGARRITRPKYEDDINPAWSPDGRRIVFDAQGDGWTDLRTVNADGSGEHKLVAGSYLTGNPARVAGGDAWSPNGRLIAYVDSRSRPAVMKPDGSDRHRLKGPPVELGGLSWSPDGRELLYDAGANIAVVKANGTGLRNFLPRGGSPVWSPDGHKVVYLRVGDVFVVNGDGSGVRKVGSGGAAPSWSPDGRWVVYARFEGRAGDIYVVHPDGSDERRLTQTSTSETDPVWSPAALLR